MIRYLIKVYIRGKRLAKSFIPACGLTNQHIQTLFNPLFKRSYNLKIESEIFELADGDFVECYWNDKPKDGDNRPIVVLFHGLTGSFESAYIQGTMQKLSEGGFASVLMHFRGCSGKMNRLPRSYHYGDTADAKAWLEHIKQNYPNSPLFAIGYSLGGSVLLKLLGEEKNDSPLRAAVAVSVPFLIDVAADKLNSGFSKLYQYVLVKQLKEYVQKKYKEHDMQSLIGLDEEEFDKISTFWEFDDAYTAPIHGFSSAKDYYDKSSAKQFLKDITTNTLVIHALDDPFMTPAVVPKDYELSSSVTLEKYSHGGHVGFVSGSFIKPKYWLEDRVVDYFKEFL